MAREPFCYLCGIATRDLHKGLCSACYLKTKELVSLPTRISAEICRECKNTPQTHRATTNSTGRTFELIAKNAVNKNLTHDLYEPDIKISIRRISERLKSVTCELEVEVTGTSEGLEYNDHHRTTLEIKKVLCDDCSRLAGGYYEATIQLRTPDIAKSLPELKKILAEIHRKDRKAFVVEETPVSGGIDIKIGSAKAAKALAAYFKKRRNVEIKESATLVGRKEGKDLYRTTTLIRL